MLNKAIERELLLKAMRVLERLMSTEFSKNRSLYEKMRGDLRILLKEISETKEQD